MNNQFPTKLILLRKHFNYSQKDIASKMNVSLEEYMSWENGSGLCNMSQLARLARLFKVTLDDLFDNNVEIEFNEVNNSIEIPFQTAINRINVENEDEEIFQTVETVVDEYETGSLDKTIVTRIISDNQMEEVNDSDTIILKKAVVNEKPRVVVKETIKEKKNYKILIMSGLIFICGVGLIIFLMNVFSSNNSNSLNSLGENNRLVASQRFTAYLASKGNIVKTGNTLSTEDFKDVIQISSRQNIILGLKEDGTVVCGGTGCDVGDFSDIVSISAGNNHSLGLKKDGTVVCSGSTQACEVETWKDVSYIYAGNNESFAISNGSVLYSGKSSNKSVIEALSNVKEIDTSNKYLVALLNSSQVKVISLDGSPLLNTSNFNNITSIAAGDNFIAGLNSNGTVSIVGDEAISKIVGTWTGIKAIASYDNYIIGINNNNIIYGAGDNSYNQYEVIEVAPPSASVETKEKLDKVSTVNFSENSKNLVLTWPAVKNADYYQVSINVSGGYTVKTNTSSLTIDANKLTRNTDYMISIVSHSNNIDKYEASDIAVVNYKYAGSETVKQYRVIFFDYDGSTILSDQMIDEGSSATPPVNPTRDGYKFVSWNGNYFNITKDTNIYATYEKNKAPVYTIIFYDVDGAKVISSTNLDEGSPVNPPQMLERENAYFKNWSPEVVTIAQASVSYKAIYECKLTGEGVDTANLSVNGTCGCKAGYSLNSEKTGCIVNPTPSTEVTP